MLERIGRRSGRARLVLAACIVVPAVAAAGAARADVSPLLAARAVASTSVGQKLYFARDGKLSVAHRAVPPSPTAAADSLRRLLAGPNADERRAGLTTSIPRGSTVLSVIQRGNVANVDLSPGFTSRAELTLSPQLGQIVFTLTQFPTIKLVRIFIDGRPLQVAGPAGTRLSLVGRHVFGAYLPAVFLESPGSGERVRSPLLVEGSATGRTFAALVGADGTLLAQTLLVGEAQARTFFRIRLRFRVSVQQTGRLIVWKFHEGKVLSRVTVPVTYVP